MQNLGNYEHKIIEDTVNRNEMYENKGKLHMERLQD